MARRILVVTVDVDNDLGRVGIETPILGREAVLRAALKFGLRRPEDTDLNAMFAALSIADMLSSKDIETEVAVLAGSSQGGVEAHMKIRNQLAEVLSKFPAEGIVLVIDSPEDERIIPILQDLVPIISVKKVVVEQSRSLEQTYVLLNKILKKITEERRYAKYFLGVPGIVILTLSILSAYNLLSYSIPVLGFILGLYMVVKGYGIDEVLSNWWKANPISFATSVISLVSFVMAAVVVYLTIIQYRTVSIKVIGDVSVNAVPFISVGISVLIISKMLDKLRNRDLTLWREATEVTVLAAATIVIVKIGSLISSLPPTSSYSDILAKLLSRDVVQTIAYAAFAVLGVSAGLAMMEKFILEKEEERHKHHGRA
ncbi:MAG: DUF373 family protein [Crenarchaeota archaeon]|nr:DUF373 family protein [Thermoproteota archaeon]